MVDDGKEEVVARPPGYQSADEKDETGIYGPEA